MEYKSAFSDVPADTWYTDAVLWANIPVNVIWLYMDRIYTDGKYVIIDNYYKKCYRSHTFQTF